MHDLVRTPREVFLRSQIKLTKLINDAVNECPSACLQIIADFFRQMATSFPSGFFHRHFGLSLFSLLPKAEDFSPAENSLSRTC